MVTLKKYSALVLVLFLAALGISLQLKAAIGVAPFDAMNQSLSFVFNMKVGDIVTIVQILFVVAQILILRKNTKWTILLQIFVGALLGQFVNFFFYNIFDSFVVENYLLRLLLLVAGSLWVPIFIGAVMVLDLVTMPVESFSMIVANEIDRPFGQIRQLVDVFCVIVSLLLTFIFSVPFTIREGTIIGALTFGPLLSFYMPKIEMLFKKWDLI